MKTILVLAVVVCAVSAQFSIFKRPTGKTCKSSADCAADECCLHNAFGKRFLLDTGSIFDSFFGGSCSKKRAEGNFCVPFTREMNIFSTKAHFATCPCMDGLICTSDKTVNKHKVFGTMETHTNAMCSKPEEGSGEDPDVY